MDGKGRIKSLARNTGQWGTYLLTGGLNRGKKDLRAQGPGAQGHPHSSFLATCTVTWRLPWRDSHRPTTQRPNPGTFPVSVHRLKIDSESVPDPPLQVLPFKGSRRVTPGEFAEAPTALGPWADPVSGTGPAHGSSSPIV